MYTNFGRRCPDIISGYVRSAKNRNHQRR